MTTQAGATAASPPLLPLGQALIVTVAVLVAVAGVSAPRVLASVYG